jgi:hypothetical protein
MKKRSSIEFARLLDWLEGRLPEEQAQAFAAQLAEADAATLAEIDWLRKFLELSQKNKLVSPPPDLHGPLRSELRRRFAGYAQGHRPQNFIERLAASLTFDSRAGPALAGMRSMELGPSQHTLVFTTRVAEIALNIQTRSEDQRLNLMGQVFLAQEYSPQEFSVQLLSGEQEVSLTSTDELGEFAFEGLPAGEYKLVLSADRFEFLIPSLKLQS